MTGSAERGAARRVTRSSESPAPAAHSARAIWIFEKLGWAHDVRWPTTQRLARLVANPR